MLILVDVLSLMIIKIFDFDFDFSFTNFLLINILSLVSLISFIYYNSATISEITYFYFVPNAFQKFINAISELASQLISDTILAENEKYFPFISLLLNFILFSNLTGLIPYTFTETSHLIVTFAVSLSVFIGINVSTFKKYRMKMFSLFLPPNTSFFLALLLASLFTSFQCFEYANALFNISDSVYGSCLYNIFQIQGIYMRKYKKSKTHTGGKAATNKIISTGCSDEKNYIIELKNYITELEDMLYNLNWCKLNEERLLASLKAEQYIPSSRRQAGKIKNLVLSEKMVHKLKKKHQKLQKKHYKEIKSIYELIQEFELMIKLHKCQYFKTIHLCNLFSRP